MGVFERLVEHDLRPTFTDPALDATRHGRPPDIYDPTYSTQQSYACVNLVRRNMDLWLPDLWFKLFWQKNADLSVRWEVEMAGMLGFVERVQPTSDYDSAKDFTGFGGVSQLEVQHKQFSYGFEFGWAMGDNVAFGPFGPGFSAADNTAYAQDDRLFDNRVVNRFMFDRDYHVDLPHQ